MQKLFRGKVPIEISEYFLLWLNNFLNSKSKIAFTYFINGIGLKYVDEILINSGITLGFEYQS